MKKKIKKNSFIHKITSLSKKTKVLVALFVVLAIVVAIVVPKIDGKNLAGRASTQPLLMYTTKQMYDAYNYAYGANLTALHPMSSANVSAPVLRSHLAKYLVAYATQVLGLVPDTSMVCEFTDLGTQSEEMQTYIIQACQLGIMGVGTSMFNPYDAVNKANFVTIFSRMLFGDLYNDGDPYYVGHLNGLYEQGIIANTSSPLSDVSRWYVRFAMMKGSQLQ